MLSYWSTVGCNLIDVFLTRSVTELPWLSEKIRKEGKRIFYSWISELKFSKKSVIDGLLPCLGNANGDFYMLWYISVAFVYLFMFMTTGFSVIGPATQSSFCPISGSSLNTLWELCLSLSCICWVEIM